jgi:hypothetical protein
MSEETPEREEQPRPGQTLEPEASERRRADGSLSVREIPAGPLRIEHLRKPDGRALTMYTRADPGEARDHG